MLSLKSFFSSLQKYEDILLSRGKLWVILATFLFGVVINLSRITTYRYWNEIGLDPAWFMGLSDSFKQGSIVGRDMVWSYGPLAQILFNIGTLFSKTGQVYDAAGLNLFFLQLFHVSLICISFWLLKPFKGKHTLLLLLAFIYLNFFQTFSHIYRYFLLIIAIQLLSRVLAKTNLQSKIKGIVGIGLYCFFCQLLTFDIGFYSLTSCVLVILLFTLFAAFPKILKKQELSNYKHYLLSLAVLLSAFFVLNLLISLFFVVTANGSYNLFDYQYYSFDLVKGYNYTMVAPWSLNNINLVVIVLQLVLIGIYLAYGLRRLNLEYSFLLSGLFILSVISLKTAIVRSDTGHIFIALLPLQFLFLILGFNWFEWRFFKYLWYPLFLVVIITWPYIDLTFR